MKKYKIICVLFLGITLFFAIFAVIATYYSKSLSKNCIYMSGIVSNIELNLEKGSDICSIQVENSDTDIIFLAGDVENPEILLSLEKGDILTYVVEKNALKSNADTYYAVGLSCEKGDIFSIDQSYIKIQNDFKKFSQILWGGSITFFILFVLIFIIYKSRMGNKRNGSFLSDNKK